MLDHQSQIIIPATLARGSVFASAVISYSLAYDATDVMNIDNLVSVSSTHIQISAVLIDAVRKSVEPIILLSNET